MDELNRRAAGTARGSEGHQNCCDGAELTTTNRAKSIRDARSRAAAQAITSDLAWFRANPWRQFRLRPLAHLEDRRFDGTGQAMLVRAFHDESGLDPSLRWLRVAMPRAAAFPVSDRTCWLLWKLHTDGLPGLNFHVMRRAA